MGLVLPQTAEPTGVGLTEAEIYLNTANKPSVKIGNDGRVIILSNDGLSDRNILTNGGFSVQQKMAVASTAIAGVSTTTRAGQVSDRWAVTASVATNINWQQVDTAAAPETGLNSRFYGSMIASSAGKKMMLSQFIIHSEMSHLRGQQVRLSVKTNIKVGNAQTLKLGLLQLNSSGTVDVCPAFLSGAWSTVTGTDPAWGTNLAAIAPDSTITGENGTVTGSYLNISAQQTTWLRSSCVFTVPSNARNLVVVLFSDATSGTTDNISVAEFQLTQGEEIVEYVEPPFAETVLRCQRFFSKSFPLTTVPAASLSVATAGNGAASIIGKAAATALASQIPIIFPVDMNSTPTLTLFTPVGAGAVPYRISGTTPAVQTTAATTGLTTKGAVVSSTGDANGAVGDLVGVHWTASCEYIN